jgi:hypothetical protein
MSFHDLRQLFALETLDTRFFVPANTPPKEALEDAALDPARPLPVQNGRTKGRGQEENVQPSRWRTPEYYFYCVFIAVAVSLMSKTVFDVSKGRH